MDLFFAENPCPVCGQVGAGFRRHESDCERFAEVGDHVHRHCGSCGHEWPEEARGLRARAAND